MKKQIVLVTALTLFASGGASAKGQAVEDTYDFAILDKSGNESVVLRVPKSVISKFPGWYYVRDGSVSFNVWYPSLVDKVAINYWTSSPTEIKASKEKPKENDRKLSISIGGRITSPKNTLDFANRPAQCGLRAIKADQPYVKEDIIDGFQKYVSYDFVRKSKNSPPIPRPYYIKYLPNKPIQGIYCLSCTLKANCRMFGVTKSGIPYSVFYEEEKMPKEAIEIHNAVGKYLSSKVID